MILTFLPVCLLFLLGIAKFVSVFNFNVIDCNCRKLSNAIDEFCCKISNEIDKFCRKLWYAVEKLSKTDVYRSNSKWQVLF